MSDKYQELITEEVTAGGYKSFLARPKEGQNLPGLIVIHEVFGLNANIKDITERFARQGYVAIAVDMFSTGRIRALCVLRTMGGLIRNALKSSHMGALQEVRKYLQELPQVNPTQVGAIGFCMGGGYALALAIADKEIKSTSIFYAFNPKPLEKAAEACPIIGSYGGKDPMTTAQGQKLKQVLIEHNRPHDIKVYPESKHSFFQATSKAYDPVAAEDAWNRTLSFFNEHLIRS
jgi:carboxymethylenebutenolidase